MRRVRQQVLGSCTRASRFASWRWRDTLASEGLDPATRCDKGLLGCASQGEHRAPGDKERWDTEGLLELVASSVIGARRGPRWEMRLVRRIAGAWPGTRSEVAAKLGKAGKLLPQALI